MMSRSGRSCYAQRDWNCSPAPATCDADNVQEDLRFQDSGSRPGQPRQGPLKQINNLTQRLVIMKRNLDEKKISLSEEKEKRIEAERQLREVKKMLEDERNLRLACEEELSQCKDIIEDLRESSTLLEAESEVQSSYEEALMSAFDEEVERLNKQLEEKSTSNLELAFKLRTQEQTTKKLEMKVAELVVEMAISAAITHQKLKVTAEGATPQSSPAEKVPKLEDVSMQTVSTQTEIFASEEGSELDVIPELPESGDLFFQEEMTTQKAVSESGISELENDQLDVIPELPEPRELIPSGDVVLPQLVVQKQTPQPEVFLSDVDSKRLLTPSLWRRFKKSITPPCRRQYKSKMCIPPPEAIKDTPKPGNFLQLEETVVQEDMSAPTKSTGPEQVRPKKPSVWKRLRKSFTPTQN